MRGVCYKWELRKTGTRLLQTPKEQPIVVWLSTGWGRDCVLSRTLKPYVCFERQRGL
jgi:hypothetical protein